MKILDLIDSPEKWTQGQYAIDASGNACGAVSSAACSWCAVGAAQRLGLGVYSAILMAAAWRLWPDRMGVAFAEDTRLCVVDVNDDVIQSYAEFRAWITEAGL